LFLKAFSKRSGEKWNGRSQSEHGHQQLNVRYFRKIRYAVLVYAR